MNVSLKVCTFKAPLDLLKESPGQQETEFNVSPQLAVPHSVLWENGQTIRVRFLEGSSFLRSKVKQVALEWEQYVNLKLEFTEDPEAEIRIAFVQGNGSWSALGTTCLDERFFPKNEPTMNYGWLNDRSKEDEIRRVVLHEFGHALGFLHEHMSPEADIPWDKPKVYEYFMGPPNNWTKEEVDFNVFNKYNIADTHFSDFDTKSIMMYSIENELTVGDYEVPLSNTLSEMDKMHAAIFYPRATSLITLKTHKEQYVSVDNSGGQALVAHSQEPGNDGIFECIDLGLSRIALRAHNGQLIGINRQGLLIVNRKQITPAEIFEFVRLDQDKAALQAANKQFVGAVEGGGRELMADREQVGDEETFLVTFHTVEETPGTPASSIDTGAIEE